MPTVKSVKKTSSRSKPSRSKTSVKRSSKPKSLKKSLNLRTTLAFFGIVIIALLAGYLVFKFNNKNELEAFPIDSNYTGGAYNFDQILNNKCDQYADSDSRKWTCYKAAQRTNYSLGVQRDSYYSNIAYSVMKKYLELYGNTNYGEWRNQAHNDPSYYRAGCQTVAVKTLVGLIENQPLSYYQGDTGPIARLRSFWGDFDTVNGQPGWGNPNQRFAWLMSAPGIPCLYAYSLLQDKLDATTKNDMSNKAYRLANYVYQNYPASTMRNQNRTSLGQGDSKAEEAVSHGAYLALYSKLARDWIYNAEDQRLLDFAGSACNDPYYCPLKSDYTLPNHNLWPAPQYAMSIPQYVMYAILPWFTQEGYDINKVPPAMRLLGFRQEKVYNPLNIFESNSRFALYSNGAMYGAFKYPNTSGITYNYGTTQYMNQYGVTDWGFSSFNRTAANTFMYLINPSNSSGYRNVDSPYTWHMTYERNALNWGTFIYSRYNNGWSLSPLPASKNAAIGAPLRPNGNSRDPRFVETGLTNDQKENLHFFLNSIKAFDHAVAYMAHVRTNYLQYINKVH